MKTGFTKAAGRTLVSAAAREGMTLVCVTLNDPDDPEAKARKARPQPGQPSQLLSHPGKRKLRDERGRPTVADLAAGCGVRVYPVGRLDLNSEGLLLLTNDGDFAQRLSHPSHQMEKEIPVHGLDFVLRKPPPFSAGERPQLQRSLADPFQPSDPHPRQSAHPAYAAN